MSSPLWALIETPAYARALRRFLRKHPDLERAHTEVIRLLSRDPHATALRLHPLGGELAGQHAVSVTYSYRITITLKIVEHEVILLNIGWTRPHDGPRILAMTRGKMLCGLFDGVTRLFQSTLSHGPG